MYNRLITSECPIASKNTEGSVSISTNGSYKTKIPIDVTYQANPAWYVTSIDTSVFFSSRVRQSTFKRLQVAHSQLF